MTNINFERINERAKTLSEIHHIKLEIVMIILLSGYTLCQDDILDNK